MMLRPEDVPPGFRFRPSPFELLGYFLSGRYAGHPIPSYAPIWDLDLYGQQEPWEIWGEYHSGNPNQDQLYFFTHLKKMADNKTGTRKVRRVGRGRGTWHGEGHELTVKHPHTRNTIGVMKKFLYRHEKDSDGKEIDHPESEQWRIDEYSLIGHQQPGDTVLCILRKNSKVIKEKKGKKQKEENYSDIHPLAAAASAGRGKRKISEFEVPDDHEDSPSPKRKRTTATENESPPVASHMMMRMVCSESQPQSYAVEEESGAESLVDCEFLNFSIDEFLDIYGAIETENVAIETENPALWVNCQG